MKLLIKTVTYISIKERVTCIITTETVMGEMHCRKSHRHNYKRDSHLHNYNEKIVTDIFAAEPVTCFINF